MTTTVVKKVLLKRGNTAQNNAYTGVYGELSIDMEANNLRIHDGVLPGGNIVSGGISGTSYANANVHAYLTSFDGSIIPSANNVYSLGSITHQWNDLWISNNTIFMNGIPLSINSYGNLTINGQEIAQGPQGIQGATGPQGPRGIEGPRGPQGNDGPMGSTGPTGPQGIQGNVGPQGPQGIQGNIGPRGPQGDQGIQGNVGDQGPQGIQGDPGPAGPQGIQGIQGNVGDQGPRGFTGNVGEQGPIGDTGPKGDTGAQGTSVTLLGSVDIVANLPMTGNAGEGWIVQSDGNLYIWNGSTIHWDDIGQIVGPQGDPGPVGPRGFTGNVGDQGPQGDQGPAGPQGIQGIQGNVGPQGPQGIQGNTGPQGPQGIQGIQGNTGPQGEQGIQGNVGPQGAIGPEGPTGPQGNAGVDGTNGIDGIGVSTATVTDGNLIITLSDATIIDAGNVVGPQGPQGIQGDPGGNANTGNIAFVDDAIYDLNGMIIENADLTHGATAAVIIPANGTTNPLQINNTYGPVSILSGTNNVTNSWLFDAAGYLVPGSDNLQDIGSPTYRVRHIYVGPGSITVGNAVITQSATGALVVPGLTRGTGYTVQDVEDTADQTHSFSSAPVIIDNDLWQALNSNTRPGYASPTFSVVQLDGEGFIDGISVDSAGDSVTQAVADNMRQNMWAYVGTDPDPINNFVAGDWIEIPFRVKVQAGNTEYEFGTGGGGEALQNGDNSFTLSDTIDGRLTLTIDGDDKALFQMNSNDLLIDSLNGNIVISAEDHIEWNFDTSGILHLPSGGDIVDSNGSSVLGGSGTPLTISETSAGTSSNVVNNVTALRFDRDTGFSVEDLGSGEVKVSLGSSFKTWTVDGQDSLVAEGEDTLEIRAGTGVTLETHNTAPKTLTISADSLVNMDGGSAGTVFDTPTVYADGGGASTRFGVNSVVFDGENTTPGAIEYNLNGGRA